MLYRQESLGNIHLPDKDNGESPEAQGRTTPREELIKTWSREKMRERAWSEPSQPEPELVFQRSVR